jgi:hypothetical protein
MTLTGPGTGDFSNPYSYPFSTKIGRRIANMRIFFYRRGVGKTGKLSSDLLPVESDKCQPASFLIRRGGAPSGAAELLARGGVGATAPAISPDHQIPETVRLAARQLKKRRPRTLLPVLFHGIHKR